MTIIMTTAKMCFRAAILRTGYFVTLCEGIKSMDIRKIKLSRNVALGCMVVGLVSPELGTMQSNWQSWLLPLALSVSLGYLITGAASRVGPRPHSNTPTSVKTPPSGTPTSGTPRRRW